MEIYKGKKKDMSKGVNKIKERLGMKMNLDVVRNMMLFSKEVGNFKGRKVKSCSIIKIGNESLAEGEDGLVRIIWRICMI